MVNKYGEFSKAGKEDGGSAAPNDEPVAGLSPAAKPDWEALQAVINRSAFVVRHYENPSLSSLFFRHRPEAEAVIPLLEPLCQTIRPIIVEHTVSDQRPSECFEIVVPN